jgi:hypothetical protein
MDCTISSFFPDTMTPPPAVASPGTGEVQVGTNYKSDTSFYAPIDWNKNGVDLNGLQKKVEYELEPMPP